MEIDKKDIVPSLRRWTDRDGEITPLGKAAADEIERLRSICAATLAKIDTLHVCCREKACERASDESLQDSACDLRIVRGLLVAFEK